MGQTFDSTLTQFIENAIRQLNFARFFILVLLAVFAFLYWKFGVERFLAQLRQFAIAFVATLFSLTAFAMVKSNLAGLAALWASPPFFADPFFAELDFALHFGNDPYVWLHQMLGAFGNAWVDISYGAVWTVLSSGMILIVAMTDRDQNRIKDMVILWTFVQIFLGNVLALAGMSAGPVYYDRLFDTERFVPLAPALLNAGLNEGFIGSVQAGLWHAYDAQAQSLGTGISAFPSIHVAVAMTALVYFASRSLLWLPLGILYVAIIQIQSVLTGYHYALDGYFSILAVGAFWWWLRRRRNNLSNARLSD